MNAVDFWGCTPLHNAVGSDHGDVVERLLEENVKTDLRNKKGLTALDMARNARKADIAR